MKRDISEYVNKMSHLSKS